MPFIIRHAAKACCTLKNNLMVREHLIAQGIPVLKDYTPTRWLSVNTCLKSYRKSYTTVLDFITSQKNKAEWYV